MFRENCYESSLKMRLVWIDVILRNMKHFKKLKYCELFNKSWTAPLCTEDADEVEE